MALTVNPVITLSSSAGSDTAASGAGPAVAISGASAAVTATSATVTITDAVDLSGVAQDGSAVLWISSTTGRQFTRISTVAGSSGAWTVTVQDNAWTAGTYAWGIGGKRGSLDNANTRKLLTADSKAGWTIQFADDPSISSTITLTTAAGALTTGCITLRSDDPTVHRTITQTANTSHFNGTMYFWKFIGLKLQNSNATKTSAVGFSFDAGGSTNTTYIQNCILGDATNKLLHGIFRVGTSQPVLVVFDCEVCYCTDYGLDNGGGSTAAFFMSHCNVHDNGAHGLLLQFSGAGVTTIHRNIFANNGSHGVYAPSASNNARLYFAENTCHNNAGDGLRIDGNAILNGSVVVTNAFTKNGGWGINYTASNGDALKGYVDYNDFGTGATANVAGAVTGLTNGTDGTLAVDPGYANATSGDFTIAAGSAVAGKGFPGTRKLGGNPATGTSSAVDVGASQAAPATVAAPTVIAPTINRILVYEGEY